MMSWPYTGGADQLQLPLLTYPINWLWGSAKPLETALECLAKDERFYCNTAWNGHPPSVPSLRPGHTELVSWERRSYCGLEWCSILGVEITFMLVTTHLWGMAYFYTAIRALHSLSPSTYLPFQVVRVIFFMDFTVACALLLLWG